MDISNTPAAGLRSMWIKTHLSAAKPPTLCFGLHLAHFIWSLILHLHLSLSWVTEQSLTEKKDNGDRWASLFLCLSFPHLILCPAFLHHSRLHYTFSPLVKQTTQRKSGPFCLRPERHQYSSKRDEHDCQQTVYSLSPHFLSIPFNLFSLSTVSFLGILHVWPTEL